MAESQRTYFMACLKCVVFISGFLLLPVSSKPSSYDTSKTCDFTKTDSSGEILSPNYPNQYPAGKACSWTITMPVFQKVVLVFINFDLEPTKSTEIGCDSGDFVEVYDRSDLIGKYCAGAKNIPPRQITSNSRTLRVVFKSDNQTTQGFRGTFRAIYSSCGGFFNEARGDLASPRIVSNYGPRYPKGFPADIDCHWQIRVPLDYVIELSFQDLNVDDKYLCDVNYVKVFDGLNASDTQIGHFCSTRLPGKSVIRSTGNTMSLEFKSYRESNSRGFKAHYTRTPHCTGFLESDYGRFTSPRYPGSRRMDQKCNWFIKVAEGKVISLLFDFFDVDSATSTFSTSKECGDDFVEVFDGTGDNDKSLGRFCSINNRPKGMVWSSGRQMLVRLQTSFKNVGSGFLASYYGVDADNAFEGCEVFGDQLLFTCKSGRKIQCQLKCDGTNDCPDASDERHCNPILVPASQKNHDIRNYVIVILSITGSALAVICIGFIVDRLRRKRTTRPRRRRQRRRHPRISTADDAPLTDEPSSPPPPYELARDRSACNVFDVAFIQPHLPSRGAGAGGDATNESHSSRSNQTQNQGLAALNQENSIASSRTQEMTSNTASDNVHEMQAEGSLGEGGETASVNASVDTISLSESISSLNDTVPLIRRNEIVIEL